MSNELTFMKVVEGKFQTLEQYVPVVARVHGGSHPEFHDVRRVYDRVYKKCQQAFTGIKPELNEEFAELRKLTDDYTVPSDVCESYEAVYKLLAEVDEVYQAL